MQFSTVQVKQRKARAPGYSAVIVLCKREKCSGTSISASHSSSAQACKLSMCETVTALLVVSLHMPGERFSGALTEVRYELPFLPLSDICGLEKFTRKILKSRPQVNNIRADPRARCLGCLIMFFENTEC